MAAESTEEIAFPEAIHLHLVSWELMEDFSDWYRDRTFSKSADWEYFCSAWKQLGLMEIEEYQFGPINELAETDQVEFVFGALSPGSVKKVLDQLAQIDRPGLDKFIRDHELAVTVSFSDQVEAMKDALDPEKGLVIFAG